MLARRIEYVRRRRYKLDLLLHELAPPLRFWMGRPRPAPTPVIPNVFHFCFGMAPDFGGRPFGIVHHLAVRSAILRNRPDRVLMHLAFEPTGPWWARTRELVELNFVEPPESVGGRPVELPAHKSDLVRLRELLRHGGFYLDLDTICVRSFEPLRRYPCVLGKEGVIRGLCNAVIGAAPGALFVRKWLEGYDPATSEWGGFTAEDYIRYSVRYPGFLAHRYRSAIHVESRFAFHHPLWTRRGMELLFGENQPASFPKAYCHHLWESASHKRYLRDLDETTIGARDSYYCRLAREVLETPL